MSKMQSRMKEKMSKFLTLEINKLDRIVTSLDKNFSMNKSEFRKKITQLKNNQRNLEKIYSIFENISPRVSTLKNEIKNIKSSLNSKTTISNLTRIINKIDAMDSKVNKILTRIKTVQNKLDSKSKEELQNIFRNLDIDTRSNNFKSSFLDDDDDFSLDLNDDFDDFDDFDDNDDDDLDYELDKDDDDLSDLL